MKLLYLTVDGQAKIESSNVRTRMIEMPDGYHPVTNDSVWQDAKRLRPPILILIQGVLGPYGSSMTEEDTKHVLFEIDVAEKAFKPQSVSKMWQRMIATAVQWFVKWGIVASVVFVVMYMLISQVLQGGM